jgi:PTS system nitrogen regulatory IIA component
MKTHDLRLSEWIRQLGIFDLQATSMQAALEEMVGDLVRMDLVRSSTEQQTVRMLLAREQIGSTGIGDGFATPHLCIQYFGVDQLVFRLGRSSEGIDWNTLDGEPVHVVALFLTPGNRPGDSLRAQEELSRVRRSVDDFTRFVLNATAGKVAEAFEHPTWNELPAEAQCNSTSPDREASQQAHGAQTHSDTPDGTEFSLRHAGPAAEDSSSLEAVGLSTKQISSLAWLQSKVALARSVCQGLMSEPVVDVVASGGIGHLADLTLELTNFLYRDRDRYPLPVDVFDELHSLKNSLVAFANHLDKARLLVPPSGSDAPLDAPDLRAAHQSLDAAYHRLLERTQGLLEARA